MPQYTLYAVDWATTDQLLPTQSFKRSYAWHERQSVDGGSGPFDYNENGFYTKFAEPPPETERKVLVRGVAISLYVSSISVNWNGTLQPGTAFTSNLNIRSILSSWDPSKVTWNNKPSRSSSGAYWPRSGASTPGYLANGTAFLANADIRDIVSNGICVYPGVYASSGGFYSNAAARAYTRWDLGTPDSANPPYLVVEYADLVPYVLNPSPTSGYVDETRSNIFTWEFGVGEGAKVKPKQQSFELEWRDVLTGTVHTITGGTASSCIIPASTFPYQQQVQWRVRVTSDDNITGNWTSWYTLTTINLASAAVAVSPSGAYIVGNEPIRFAWLHASPTGTAQTKWELQARQGNGAYVTFAQGIGDQQSYLLERNDWTAGPMEWRVRTANTQGVWGEWSESLLNYIIAAPDAPTVNAVDTTASRPRVTWQSPVQMAYQLQVVSGDTVIYDSGMQAGMERAHNVGIYLADGQYTFRVRVQNEYGIWSDWGSRVDTILTDPPDKPEITCAGIANGVTVTVKSSPEGATLFLYRSEGGGAYIPIARLEGSSYTDYTSIGSCRYFVRAVVGGVFADSAVCGASPYIRSVLIASEDAPGDIVALRLNRGDYPGHDINTRFPGELAHFEGRALPVMLYSAFEEREMTHTYSLRSRAEFEHLTDVLRRRRALLYRDEDGRKLYCVAMELPARYDRHTHDITLTIQGVDYSEAIDDTPPETTTTQTVAPMMAFGIESGEDTGEDVLKPAEPPIIPYVEAEHNAQP